MKITLGLHLDGEHGWRPAHRLGEPILGPMGMLNLLETRLGLLRAECSHAERIVQYRECLKRCDGPDRFFHASFDVDPLGTAATLLSWRDTWWLHGWNGEPVHGASVRMADMVAVEADARRLVSPSMGERLAEVSEVLAKADCRIERIELADPIEAFPKRWRDVLARLPVRSTRDYAPKAAAKSVLGKLQVALLAAHSGKKPQGRIAWCNDGSLRVVRAETTLSAARLVAHVLHSSPGDIALVAEHERSLLDATLDAADVSRQGFQEASPFAPALQVLPLALATVWEPLDVYALLEFLSHPIGPIPGYARRRLAEVVADSPGIGGPRWVEAMAEIDKRDPDRAAETREAVAFWVEHPRYPPVPGAPLEALLPRARRVRDYFGIRLADDDPVRSAPSAAAYAQADAVTIALEAMAAQGETSIKPAALEALVAQCTGQGAPNVAMHGQIGRVPAASTPGALIESFARVIWWQMAAPPLPRRYPWTRGELAALESVGVDLPPMTDVLARQGLEWLRPVLNARSTLVLVLPPAGEEVHPLWQEVQSFVDGVEPERLEAVMTGSLAADLPELTHAPLPPRRRWWQLPPEARIPRRERESYSSLDTFLNSPYQWVLQYVARLNPSNLLVVTDENRLYGNLAHRLVDRLFRSNDASKLRGDALQHWFSREFDRAVADEGAVLLMPGRRADCEKLRSALARALEELQRQFVEANVVRVESERNLSGTFEGGELGGTADLVVHTGAQAQALVDMKWSGATFYRRRFAENRHLQLAIYGEMLRQDTGAWPEVSYFILQNARLLARDTAFFPQARPVENGDRISTPLLWQAFLKTWRWRRAQIDAGSIEVAIEGIDATEASVAPDDALQPEELRPEYNDYRWLAGWEG